MVPLVSFGPAEFDIERTTCGDAEFSLLRAGSGTCMPWSELKTNPPVAPDPALVAGTSSMADAADTSGLTGEAADAGLGTWDVCSLPLPASVDFPASASPFCSLDETAVVTEESPPSLDPVSSPAEGSGIAVP